MDPVINLEDKIGKTVGRRLVPNPLRVRENEIQEAKEWRRGFGGIRVPRGVFRFRSHEEADAWLMKHLIAAATKAN
jgi:hypothetical protein